jgi:hypothetical protein
MRGPTLIRALVGTFFLVTACDNPEPVSPSIGDPVFAPADGNGNKEVVQVDEDFTVNCDGGEILDANTSGWFQVRSFNPPNRNLELAVFHAVISYTNSAGETFTFRDVGPDRLYMDNGNLIIAITGRSTGSGVIGHFVFNISTGEVELVAGIEFGNVDDLACAALT